MTGQEHRPRRRPAPVIAAPVRRLPARLLLQPPSPGMQRASAAIDQCRAARLRTRPLRSIGHEKSRLPVRAGPQLFDLDERHHILCTRVNALHKAIAFGQEAALRHGAPRSLDGGVATDLTAAATRLHLSQTACIVTRRQRHVHTPAAPCARWRRYGTQGSYGPEI